MLQEERNAEFNISVGRVKWTCLFYPSVTFKYGLEMFILSVLKDSTFKSSMKSQCSVL